ncbi:hypothetical protein FRC02_009487 [Tulasnella sp. 418]|nr:hypothetical protein FRC02_009487 [Tulasnella sp. 418]
MQTDVKQIFESFKPPLLSSGYDEELVDRWISLAQKEVTEMRPRLFAKWRYAWAVRNSTQWVEPSFSD